MHLNTRKLTILEDGCSRLNDSSDITIDFLLRKNEKCVSYIDYEIELKKLFEETNRISSILDSRYILVTQELERLQRSIDNFQNNSSPKGCEEAKMIKLDIKKDFVQDSVSGSSSKLSYKEQNKKIKYKVRYWINKGRSKIMVILKVKKNSLPSEGTASSTKCKEKDQTLFSKPTLSRDNDYNEKDSTTNYPYSSINDKVSYISGDSISNINVAQEYNQDRLPTKPNVTVTSQRSRKESYCSNTISLPSSFNVLTPLVQISTVNNIIDFEERSNIGTSEINTPEFFKLSQKCNSTKRASQISDSTLNLIENTKKKFKDRFHSTNTSFEKWTNTKKTLTKTSSGTVNQGVKNWNMKKRHHIQQE